MENNKELESKEEKKERIDSALKLAFIAEQIQARQKIQPDMANFYKPFVSDEELHMLEECINDISTEAYPILYLIKYYVELSDSQKDDALKTFWLIVLCEYIAPKVNKQVIIEGKPISLGTVYKFLNSFLLPEDKKCLADGVHQIDFSSTWNTYNNEWSSNKLNFTISWLYHIRSKVVHGGYKEFKNWVFAQEEGVYSIILESPKDIYGWGKNKDKGKVGIYPIKVNISYFQLRNIVIRTCIQAFKEYTQPCVPKLSKNNPMSTPTSISGFRELLPAEKILENRFLDTIRRWYERAGFTPIETPAIERTSTLTTKGVDHEIYAIRRLDDSDGAQEDEGGLGLHFDLTVPLARYVAQHFEALDFPFRRYQIQKVWRGERPQRYRYREFTQADIDIIGNGSLPLFADAEILFVINGILGELDIGEYRMVVNDRRILSGFLMAIGCGELESAILPIIDKRRKVGNDATRQSLTKVPWLDTTRVEQIMTYLCIPTGDFDVAVRAVETIVSGSDDTELLMQGLTDIREVYTTALRLGVRSDCLVFDPSLARGLTYYTGTMYETFLVGQDENLSVCSGGRYDRLVTGPMGQSLPGVGVSIGLTRLFEKLLDAGRIVPREKTPTRLLVTRMDERYIDHSMRCLRMARDAGINAEIIMESGMKFGKQMSYADRRNIPYVLIIGEDEIARGEMQIKNMQTSEVQTVSLQSEVSDWGIL